MLPSWSTKGGKLLIISISKIPGPFSLTESISKKLSQTPLSFGSGTEESGLKLTAFAPENTEPHIATNKK